SSSHECFRRMLGCDKYSRKSALNQSAFLGSNESAVSAQSRVLAGKCPILLCASRFSSRLARNSCFCKNILYAKAQNQTEGAKKPQLRSLPCWLLFLTPIGA